MILESQNLNGYPYVILSTGAHPFACVGLNKEHPCFGWDSETFFRKDVDIEIHGGLVYCGFDVDGIESKDDQWWVCWDYAHLGDFVEDSYYGSALTNKNKKWKLEEIRKDVKKLIDQLEIVRKLKRNLNKIENKRNKFIKKLEKKKTKITR